ncbi:hypothetical protein EGW08_000485 [Elysia chlorotica]|uniref:Uncharacterized protein n=1 Tax=Elysia chlorotica TaxID=188477 RepID=A0A433UD24_ELYCH|nr:hypothetical protein EGW08_000485 [Elysia chlorotica]
MRTGLILACLVWAVLATAALAVYPQPCTRQNDNAERKVCSGKNQLRNSQKSFTLCCLRADRFPFLERIPIEQTVIEKLQGKQRYETTCKCRGQRDICQRRPSRCRQ